MALKGQGKSFKYGMPIYGLEWPKGDTIFVCGGGGNGIKNRRVVGPKKFGWDICHDGCPWHRIVCASVTLGGLTDQTAEFLFGDDCPMR